MIAAEFLHISAAGWLCLLVSMFGGAPIWLAIWWFSRDHKTNTTREDRA